LPVFRRWPTLTFCFICLFVVRAISYSQSDLAQQAGALMEAGRFHEAEALWRELAKGQPRNASAHASLGLAMARQGEFSEAAAEYRMALALHPNQPEISFDLGLAEFKLGARLSKAEFVQESA
jgi:Flp pilus assembly protein TadD